MLIRPGQPFDIVKVRMQVQANKSAIQVARDIWKHEGGLAFYKVANEFARYRNPA